MTVVLVSHFMDEVEELCDRVAILERGRIAALDTPAGLVDSAGGEGDPRHPGLGPDRDHHPARSHQQTGGDAERERRIGNATRLARDSLAEARRSVQALRPQALENSMLPDALAEEVNPLDRHQRRARRGPEDR